MSNLYPANGMSVLAPQSSGGILDTVVGELKYLGEALRDNLDFTQPAPAPEAKAEAVPSYAPSPVPGRR